MATIKLGKLSIDAVSYGINGNAILGIKESGKTYGATYIAESLFDAGIPFITFDPTGVWRFLRVPGKGKGYPIVVAGGEAPDLPLTVNGAPEIVRAAMRNGVSLVIDLFDKRLSKGDWRKIVTECVRVLLFENKPHGLRHVFFEEAAEFVPQKVLDGIVYAEVEKLARIGGNSRLGYTLINPRSQEVNKAVLELCENVLLFRQRGKNALENMEKWLAIAGAEQKEIMASLPDLPTGQCWAWIGGDKPQPPVLVKIPAKDSMHPDRRMLRGDDEVKVKRVVDVTSFVDGMKSTLVKVEEEDKANNPVRLRADLAALRKQMADAAAAAAKAGQTPDPEAIAKAEQHGYDRAKRELAAAAESQAKADRIAFLACVGGAIGPLMDILKEETQAARARPDLAKQLTFTPSPLPVAAHGKTAAGNGKSRGAGYVPPPKPRAPAGADSDGSITGPQRQLLQALAWWKAMGHDRVTRVQVASICGWRVTSGHLKNVSGSLRTKGLIDYPGDGLIALTPEGAAAAPEPDTSTTLEDSVLAILTGPQRQVFECLPQSGVALTRDQVAQACGWEPTSGHVKNVLGSMRSLEVIDYPSQGQVARAEWLTQ